MNGNTIQLINNARSVLIVVSKNAKLDSLAAGLGFYLALIAQGKSARIATEAQVQGSDKLVGFDKLTKTVEQGGNILKVSFPYTDGNIDKVTYNITDDRFNLLIEPRQGAQPLTNKDVVFGYTGGQTDLIVTTDAPSLDALGDPYLENPDLFVREKIINIDRRFDNQQYGAENLVEKQSSSTSEIVLRVLDALHWDLNPDIATNLYSGLVSATNNFTSFSTNAQSFEAASVLLKNGARKLPVNQPPRPSFNQAPSFAPMPVENANISRNQNVFQGNFSPNPAIPVQPAKDSEASRENAKPETKPVSKAPQEANTPAQSGKKPPQDWLKPKIFKSTDLI